MFCDNLKKYRKTAGMTQEEVAKFLMVTPQAVSKWETGNGTPDISLLIPIAELFGVSTDELLGRKEMLRDSTLEEIYESGESLQDKYTKYTELLKRYPGNAQILLKLLSVSAERLHLDKALSDAEKESIMSNAKEYARRLQKENAYRDLAEVHGRLSDVYAAYGDFEHAKEEAQYLPGARYTQNRMLGNLAVREKKPEECRMFFRNSIHDTLGFLLWDIERIAQSYAAALKEDFKANRAEMDAIYAIEYHLIHAINAEGSALLTSYLSNAAIRMAQKAIWAGDTEQAFEYLEEHISCLRQLRDTTKKERTAQSPILPPTERKSKTISKESALYRLSWNCFTPIRNTPRFQSYLKEVESW